MDNWREVWDRLLGQPKQVSNQAPVPPSDRVQKKVEVEDPTLKEAVDEAVRRVLAYLLDHGRSQQEQVTIGPGGYTLDYHGYRYVYAWSPQTATLTVEALGQQLSFALRAVDYTALTLPQGARLFASSPTTVLLFYTNELMVTSKIG